MGTRRSVAGVVGLAALCLAASCAPAIRVYVNPEADPAFYRKIAVLPFADMSATSMAGARVTRAFVTELILTDRFEIVQPEDFTSTLQRMGIFKAQDGSYDPEKLKNAAAQLGVTGILRGAVTEYETRRGNGGDVPTIAFDAELIDVAAGKVVWRSSISKRGKGRVAIVGTGIRSLGRLTGRTTRPDRAIAGPPKENPCPRRLDAPGTLRSIAAGRPDAASSLLLRVSSTSDTSARLRSEEGHGSGRGALSRERRRSPATSQSWNIARRQRGSAREVSRRCNVKVDRCGSSL